MKTQLTEQDVLAYLKERAASTGIKGLELSAQTNAEMRPFAASVKKPGMSICEYGFGKTIEEAVSELLPNIKSAKEIADALRAKADKIEKEAAA